MEVPTNLGTADQAGSSDSCARTSRAFLRHLLQGAAMAVALAAPASADVLVSNIGQTASGTKALNNTAVAQAFTTGPNVTGYTLTSVEVKFGTAPDAGVQVRLLEGDQDGSAHATLTNPSSLTPGNLTFTAPRATYFAANTTYTVVIDSATSGTLSETNTDTVDSGGASGWSIADSSDVGPAPWTDSASEILIRVNGTVHSAGEARTGNIGQTDAGGVPVVGDFAQKFHSGNFPMWEQPENRFPENGYWLSRIRIPYYVDKVVPTAPTHVVSLHSDSSGSIGSQIATFSRPPWPTSDESASYSTRDFVPASTVTLAGNTDYWLVWDMQSNPTHTMGSDTSTVEGKVGTTAADDEDEFYWGWSIADDSLTRAWDSTTWATSTDSMRLEIVATIRPDNPPTVSSAAVNGRELIIDFHKIIAPLGALSTSDFTVTVDGSDRALALRGASVADNGFELSLFRRVAIDLASRVYYGETVKVSYSGTRLQGGSGFARTTVEPFTDQAVTNETPDYSCPGDATGTYPGCSCDSGSYDLGSNACVAEPCNCPQAWGGEYPNCGCFTGDRYDASLNICEEIPWAPCGYGDHRHEGRPCHRTWIRHDGPPARICRHERKVGDAGPGGNGGGSGGGGGGGAPPNRAPVATADIERPVLDVGHAIEIDATRHFRDPEGDDLTFSATAGDDTVVSVTVDGSTIRIEGLRHGETTVSVTARDTRRGTATQEFPVSVGWLAGFRESRVSVPEGDSITLEIVLNRERETDTVVHYVVQADDDPKTGDADAGDHDAVDGAVTIPAGETVASLDVTIHDDEDIEPVWEVFTLTLQRPLVEPLEYDLSTPAVTVTIEEGVCDRTKAVRDGIRRSLPCARVDPDDMDRVRTLSLRDRGITALQSTDLLGLHALRFLDLKGNSLQELPAGLFSGLTSLAEMDLTGNPGAPFNLVVGLSRTDAGLSAPGPATVVATVAEGAPFDMEGALTATDGTLPRSMTIARGSLSGAPLTVRHAASVRMEIARPPVPPDDACGDVVPVPCYRGLTTSAGPPIILFREPPEATGTPPEPAIVTDDETRIDLSELAAASDGGALTFAAYSSDTSLLLVHVEGSVLTVTSSGREGTATVTVIATDAEGLTVAIEFQVRVEFASRGLLRGARGVLLTEPTRPVNE